jgi:hypothetical protein
VLGLPRHAGGFLETSGMTLLTGEDPYAVDTSQIEADIATNAAAI